MKPENNTAQQKQQRKGPYKGKYSPVNPQKYKGNPTNIIYRSSWELRLMKVFDLREDIIQWSSEEIFIHYKTPIDRKIHRYFPDFIVTARKKDGSIVKYMIEVKPDKQTRPPKVQPSKTPKYINEVMTWATNKSKWEAAEAYCKVNGMQFVILTEKNAGFV